MAGSLLALLLAAAAGQDGNQMASSQSVSKMGIPYRPDDQRAGPEELVKAIRARRKGGKLLNLDRMLLHSPAFAKGWNAMFGAIRGQLALPGRLRELSILAIAVLNDADYEWAQHEPELIATGGTKEQLAALKDVAAAAADEKLFTEAERATLQLAIEMTKNVKVAPETMKRVRAALPDQQVVELVGTIAGYNMVSRFLAATGVGME